MMKMKKVKMKKVKMKKMKRRKMKRRKMKRRKMKMMKMKMMKKVRIVKPKMMRISNTLSDQIKLVDYQKKITFENKLVGMFLSKKIICENSSFDYSNIHISV